MMTLYTELKKCVLCRSMDLRRSVALAPIPIATPNFKLPAAISEAQARESVPLDLYQCENCGHIQVGFVGNPDLQYRDYVYDKSLSFGLAEHFRHYAAYVVETLHLAARSLIVEIGSNDGTLLAGFAAGGMRVQGVDPARRIAQAASAAGIPTIGDFFDDRVALEIRDTSGLARVIVANNVIANVAKLDAVLRGVELLLSDDGIFIFETQYGGDVVERALIDTVYHEHISYFLTKPTRRWLAAFGLDLIDVVSIDTKGGSFRLFAQKVNGPRTVGPAVATWIEREERSGMFDQVFFDELGRRVACITDELHTLVNAEHASGNRVGGFGVSVGTLTLLAQFKLCERIDFLVDDDPNKGAFLAGPGYRIPVFTADILDQQNARMIIVFAWRYMASIRRRHAGFLDGGGSFVVPLPHVTRERAAGSAATSS